MSLFARRGLSFLALLFLFFSCQSADVADAAVDFNIDQSKAYIDRVLLEYAQKEGLLGDRRIVTKPFLFRLIVESAKNSSLSLYVQYWYLLTYLTVPHDEITADSLHEYMRTRLSGWNYLGWRANALGTLRGQRDALSNPVLGDVIRSHTTTMVEIAGFLLDRLPKLPVWQEAAHDAFSTVMDMYPSGYWRIDLGLEKPCKLGEGRMPESLQEFAKPYCLGAHTKVGEFARIGTVDQLEEHYHVVTCLRKKMSASIKRCDEDARNQALLWKKSLFARAKRSPAKAVVIDMSGLEIVQKKSLAKAAKLREREYQLLWETELLDAVRSAYQSGDEEKASQIAAQLGMPLTLGWSTSVVTQLGISEEKVQTYQWCVQQWIAADFRIVSGLLWEDCDLKHIAREQPEMTCNPFWQPLVLLVLARKSCNEKTMLTHLIQNSSLMSDVFASKENRDDLERTWWRLSTNISEELDALVAKYFEPDVSDRDRMEPLLPTTFKVSLCEEEQATNIKGGQLSTIIESPDGAPEGLTPEEEDDLDRYRNLYVRYTIIKFCMQILSCLSGESCFNCAKEVVPSRHSFDSASSESVLSGAGAGKPSDKVIACPKKKPSPKKKKKKKKK